MNTETRIALHPIDERAFWMDFAQMPEAASLCRALLARADAAPSRPVPPSASDFLAARRLNDRSRLDTDWQVNRATLAALAFRRCLKGLDPDDPDDRLLDWLWSLLTLPTWVVSAHLPGNDLPDLASPTLDLASCEMAAFMAELRQALKPWMDSVSGTLAGSIVTEIDRRILQPYADGVEVWWDNPARGMNNWAGVCAGSILATCESLAAQGFPRPEARRRAMRTLQGFLSSAFTAEGECDEGVGYWSYGIGMACLGWSRLSRREFETTFDLARFKAVAGYPQRAYLFGDSFFTGNDGGLHASACSSFVPWLARMTDSEWLARWARQSGKSQCRHFGQIVNTVDAIARGWVSSTPDPSVTLDADAGAQWLPDQQAGILRIPTPRGQLLAIASGGHNAERHNHNDLGHVMLALDGQWVIPDLGAPHYTADFFGPRRYTYLSASSRGHCCPLINGQEQRAGRDAAGRVLCWDPAAERPCLELDLTAAYPAEAQLRQWHRRLERRGTTAMLTDTFQTAKGGAPVTQTFWSLIEPQAASGGLVRLGPIALAFTPAPSALRVTPINPADHALRDYTETVYRIEADYATATDGGLTTMVVFSIDGTPFAGTASP